MSSTSNRTISFQISAAKQALIDRAAAVSGKNRIDFILDASCEKAREVLTGQTHFAVSRKVMQRFNELVESPLVDPKALQQLLRTPAPWER